MSIDSRTFRNALGSFATGITVVTVAGPDGAIEGVTINSFASVSLDPPLVLFSLGKNSAILSTFKSASRFAVHVLSEDQQDISIRFAGATGKKFENLDIDTAECGTPLLKNCLAHFICSKFQEYDGGDHVIFVGKVESLADSTAGQPLIYYRGAYSHLK